MPIIDAAMREMNVTGFMGNRARQFVASYLTMDL
jgi:deoxyribodipyrimidine photolyase